MKKKRVETFRNIRYGDGRIYYYTDSAAAVGPAVQARPAGANLRPTSGANKIVRVLAL